MLTLAMLASLTVALIGLIAEPIVRSNGCPTGTEAVAGVTVIGGGVGVGAAALGSARGLVDDEETGEGVLSVYVDDTGAGVFWGAAAQRAAKAAGSSAL